MKQISHESLQLQVTKVVKTITCRTYHPLLVSDNLLVESRPATRTPTPVTNSTPTLSETDPVKDAEPVWFVLFLASPRLPEFSQDIITVLIFLILFKRRWKLI